MVVRVHCACTFLLLFSLILSSVLTGQSLEDVCSKFRLSDEKVSDIDCNEQWLLILLCSKSNNVCYRESTV